jgi:hypothetical protein
MTSRSLLMASLLAASAAFADRGALSLDVGGAGVAVSVPAPLVQSPKSTLSYGGGALLGARYALSNHLEAGVWGFFEMPVTVYQDGVNVVASSGVYPGTLKETFTRGGALAGVHFVFGMRFRLILGLEAGWAASVHSGMKHFDVSDPNAAVDYGLTLNDVTTHALLLSPTVGLQWAAGDKWSLALLPRAQLALGKGAGGWAVSIPLIFSWDFYP